MFTMETVTPRRSSRLRSQTPQREIKPVEAVQSLEPVIEHEPESRVTEQKHAPAVEPKMPGCFPDDKPPFKGSFLLSPEGQEIMAEVRKKAANMMPTIRAEEEAESRQRTQVLPTGRVYARPKGRFSDAHESHFGKMSSIANHPSAFRAPVASANTMAGAESATPDKPQTPAKRRRLTEDAAIRTPTRPPNTMLASQSSAQRAGPARSTSKIPRTPSSTGLMKTPTKCIKTEGNHRFRNAISHHIPRIKSPIKSILRISRPHFSIDPAKLAAGTHVAPPEFANAAQAAENPRSPKRVGFFGLPGDMPTSSSRTVRPKPSTLSAEEASKAVATGESASSVVYPDLSAAASVPSNDILYPAMSASPTRPRNFTFRADQQLSFAVRKSPSNTSSKSAVPTIRQVLSSTPSEATPPVSPIRLSHSRATSELAYKAHGLANKKRKHSDSWTSGGLDIVVKDSVDQSPSRGALPPQKLQTPTKTHSLGPSSASKRVIKTPFSVRIAKSCGIKPTQSPTKLGNNVPIASIQHGLANKKRKHDELNDTAGLDIVVADAEDDDKENTPSRRGYSSPAKKVRLTSATPNTLKKVAPPKSGSRNSTVKTPLLKPGPQTPSRTTGSRIRTGLSLARLNALSAPKKR